MQKYANTVTDTLGNVVSLASVSVYTDAAHTALATVYSDNGITPTTNPRTTDSLGNFSFYAADGRYYIKVSKSGVTTQFLDDVLLFDSTASGSSGSINFVQSGTGALTSTVQAALRLFVHTSQYDTTPHYVTARDALTGTLGFGKFDSAVSTIGRVISKARSAADGLPNTETGAPWLRLEYDDPDCSSSRAIDLSFYEFGQILRFTGDGTTANNSRSVFEFWGADGVGPTYRPIMTLVMSSTEHEVHVARDESDVDAIICSYLPVEGPVIYTEAGRSAFLDLGVQRLRKVRVSTTNLNLVSGQTLGWTSSTTDPGGTVDINLTRSAAGVLAMGAGDALTGTQTTFKFNNGGFAPPGSANATSNGDKQIYWNTATLKVAQGLDDATLWWQCNASVGTPVFKWFGGTSTAPALSMTLDQTAALKVVGGFGCNGSTAQTAAASGGALAAYSAGANGLDSGAHMSALHALVVAMRAALVANGIMS